MNQALMVHANVMVALSLVDHFISSFQKLLLLFEGYTLRGERVFFS